MGNQPTHYSEVLNQWEQIKYMLDGIDMDVIKASHCVRRANQNARKVLQAASAQILDLVTKLQKIDKDVKNKNDDDRKQQASRVYNFDPNTYVRKEEEDASE